MKRVYIFGLLFLSLLRGLLAKQSAPAQAEPASSPNDVGHTPSVVAEEGVSSFALRWPRITWNSSPPCVLTPAMSNVPADEDGREVITRMVAYRGNSSRCPRSRASARLTKFSQTSRPMASTFTGLIMAGWFVYRPRPTSATSRNWSTQTLSPTPALSKKPK